MLKISKKVEYALMALKYMAIESMKQPESHVSVREICDQFNIPFDTLSKVLQSLQGEGIVKANQGVKGGYKIQKDLAEISYYQLNITLEGDSFGHYCFGPKSICDQYCHCNILTSLNLLNHKIIEFFKNINLKELLITNQLSNQLSTPLVGLVNNKEIKL